MSKKIVIASDSFKGSASSKAIGTYISEGILSLYPDYQTIIYSVADGGEGTVVALLDVVEGEKITITVKGPLGSQVKASYGLIENGEVAIIEMAEASGITLVPKEQLDIMKASTYGTGQLIFDAVNRGASKIYIGIGGSATNDGGMGMAQALGARFLDEKGNELIGNGANLEKIETIDMSGFLFNSRLVDVSILSDVTNPLIGPNGATAIFGPQKGATQEMVEQLENGLVHYASKLKSQFGKDIAIVEGSGAAGGLGAALMIFLQAKMCRGIDEILKIIQIEKDIQNADLVITGEGRLDGQSLNGKVPIGIAKIAEQYKVPTIAIVGSHALEMENIYKAGILGVFDIINQPMGLEEAMQQTPELVRATAKNIIHFYTKLSL